tara:strand:- start:206 stop:487 length:282 start_codon:yes stop_codon:yes gene_type:complete
MTNNNQKNKKSATQNLADKNINFYLQLKELDPKRAETLKKELEEKRIEFPDLYKNLPKDNAKGGMIDKYKKGGSVSKKKKKKPRGVGAAKRGW